MAEIKWKYFDETVDGMNLNVKWWSKDYVIKYESKYGIMSYGLHLMYMMPKVYTQEELRNCCKDTAKLFKECEDWISENKDSMEFTISIVEMKKHIEETDKIVSELVAEKSELKKALKNDEIDEKNYQKKLKEIKNKIYEIKRLISDYKLALFEKMIDSKTNARIIMECLYPDNK